MVRPSKGLGHVDGLPCELQSKQRMRVILSTISGQLRVDEGCRQLSIGPTHFDTLRRRFLLGGGAALAPRPIGRPRRTAMVSMEEVESLRERNAELEREVVVLRARLELAALGGLPETPRSKSRGRASTLGRGPGSAAALRRAVP